MLNFKEDCKRSCKCRFQYPQCRNVSCTVDWMWLADRLIMIMMMTTTTTMMMMVAVCAGDIEALMGLSTYMQTSKCTQTSEVFVLSMKHYERLFVRRHPQTIHSLRRELELRIRSRITSRWAIYLRDVTLWQVSTVLLSCISLAHYRRSTTNFSAQYCC